MLHTFPTLDDELSRADVRRAVQVRALAVEPRLRAAAGDDPFREQLLLGSLQALHPREAILAGPYFWAHLQSVYAALTAERTTELGPCLDRLGLAALDSFALAPGFRWDGRLRAPPFLEFHLQRLGVVGRRGVALREIYWATPGANGDCLNMVFEDDGEFEISLPPLRADGSLQPPGLRLTAVDPAEFDVADNAAKLEDDPDAISSFRAQLAAARDALEELSPTAGALADSEAWYVVPLRRAARHLSFSLSPLPRLVFIGASDTLWPVLEALVHEVGHLRLNRAALALPFTNGPRSPVCYSPWRDDPRPVDGLIHGTYAFTLVLGFWLDALAAGSRLTRHLGSQGLEYALARIATLGVQLEDAHEVLSRCELSPFGSSLVARLRAVLPPVDDLPAGRVAIDRARARADGHRRRSTESHPGLIAPAAARL